MYIPVHPPTSRLLANLEVGTDVLYTNSGSFTLPVYTVPVLVYYAYTTCSIIVQYEYRYSVAYVGDTTTESATEYLQYRESTSTVQIYCNCTVRRTVGYDVPQERRGNKLNLQII